MERFNFYSNNSVFASSSARRVEIINAKHITVYDGGRGRIAEWGEEGHHTSSLRAPRHRMTITHKKAQCPQMVTRREEANKLIRTCTVRLCCASVLSISAEHAGRGF